MNDFKQIFNKFFDNRDSLILKFNEGDINKSEYIRLNVEFMKEIDVKPFKKVDSYEKGIFNYQYYNMLAKYYFMEADELKKNSELSKYIQSFIDEGTYYYKLKDNTTLQLLKLIKFRNVEAYFIKVNSESLDGKLFEINLKDFDKSILHSKSYKILNLLKTKGVFLDEVKKSLIDEYVNEKY